MQSDSGEPKHRKHPAGFPFFGAVGVIAIDIASGAAVWSHTGYGDFAGSPAVAGGLVVAGTVTGHVYAFASTGFAGLEMSQISKPL